MNKKKLFFVVSGTILIILAVVIVNPFSKPSTPNKNHTDNSSNTSAQENNEINFPVTAAVVRKGNLIKWVNTSGYAYPVKQTSTGSAMTGSSARISKSSSRRFTGTS